MTCSLSRNFWGNIRYLYLVEYKTEDVGRADERFIPVQQTRVVSYPYVTGRMSINSGTMSHHVKTTLPGVERDQNVLDFGASIVIVPPLPEKPGVFSLYARYKTRLGTGSSSSGITWDGSILKMDHSADYSLDAQYTLFWVKK